MKAHVTVLDPQKAYKEVIENADLTEVSMYRLIAISSCR